MPQGPLPSADELREREAPARKIASYAAVASALLTVAAMLVEYTLAQSNVPDFDASDVVQTLAAAHDGTAFPPSFLAAVGEFRIAHNGVNVVLWVLRAASVLLLIPMAQLLIGAVRLRGGQLGAWVAPVSLAGFLVTGAGTFIVFGILEPGIYRAARDAGFGSSDVWDAVRDSPISTAQIVMFVGSAAVAITLGFASAQAVRLGLLPRTIGYLGVLIGMMFAFPLDPSNIVRAFWFSALAFLVSGRLQDRTPPAWDAGEAVVPEPRQPAAPRTKPAKR
jgi:hypothetical protein